MKRTTTFFIMLSAILVGLSFIVNAQVPTNGLVGYYPFNGNANDESGNGNNGTVNGATLTTDSFGNPNSAYSFNGTSSYISVTNNASLNFAANNKITVGMWFYPTAYPDVDVVSHRCFISKQTGSGTTQQGFSCSFQNNPVTLTTRNGSSDNMGYASYTYALPLNQWCHIVMVYDNGDGYFYYNGNLVQTNLSQVSTIGDNTSDLYIGKATWSNINADPFAGKMDDIIIYNRALNLTEVKKLYSMCSDTTIYDTLSITVCDSALLEGSYQNTTGMYYDTLQSFYGCDSVLANYLDVSNPYPYTDTVTVYDTIWTNDTVWANDTIWTNDTLWVNDTLWANDTIWVNDTITVYDTIAVYDSIAVTDTLIIDVITGLPVPNNVNTVKVYPNPAKDHIYIDNGNYSTLGGYTLKITNSIGQQVFSSLINQQQFYLDLSTWGGNGTYFVYIIDAGSNTVDVRKIILQ